MLRKLPELIQNKRIALLGFGMEGQSSFLFLSKYFPEQTFLIADQNSKIKQHKLLINAQVEISCGPDYLDAISAEDFIIKSPGIKLPKEHPINTSLIYSQTDLFIQAFQKQIIGITGTKGKSTTSSLLFNILTDQSKKAILIGNIGKPAFDYWDLIDKDTYIVFELSAHQLEYLRYSPSYSILLNLFPEHLDYFKNTENYFNAKLNIAKFQTNHDYFFWNQTEDEKIKYNKLNNSILNSKYAIVNETLILKENSCPILRLDEMQFLKGVHQLKNCIPLLDLSDTLSLNRDQTLNTIKKFRPLPHRIEYLGQLKNVHFYNDSISTIPEATIEAVKALKIVNYLILGGLDRGINYEKLYDFLKHYTVEIIFFIGPAGERMHSEMTELPHTKKVYIEKLKKFEMEIEKLIAIQEEKLCLLSPAAASYDEFKNFEERGDYFRSLIKKFM